MYYFSCFFCKVSKLYKLIYSQRTKIKITRRSRLRQNRCVFSAPRNYCPRDRSRWRRLSGRLFHSSIVLRLMDSDRICSLTIAGQHLSIIRQVHGLCLGLTGRLREKRTKSEGSSAIWGPAPGKNGGQLTPWTPWLRDPWFWSTPQIRSAFYRVPNCSKKERRHLLVNL